MLWSFIRQVRLELSSVLLILLDEGLILVGDIVVIQERPFVEPVWQMWNRRLHNLEGAILVNVLAICAQHKVLLHLTVLSKR